MSNVLSRACALTVAAGSATLLGALCHAQAYRVRRRTVVVNQPELTEATYLRILHISDPHLRAQQSHRHAFLKSLADLDPDFVVLTGDLIAEDDAIGPLLNDLGPLLNVPGAFVFGSNDYFGPQLKNPLRYLWGHTGKDSSEDDDATRPVLATEDLRRGLGSGGWIDLNNSRQRLTVGPWTLDLVGINDPHIGLDRMPAPVALPSPASPYLRLGLAHAPYQRVLTMMANDDVDMTFAGHTHGGQVNLPGSRALVTNCDLPPHYANGLFAWPPAEWNSKQARVIKGNGSVVLDDQMLVQISAGIGTSPYTPVRTFCAPEAIILDIVAV